MPLPTDGLTVTPATGPPGTPVSIRGAGFTEFAGRTVDLWFSDGGGDLLWTWRTEVDAQGRLSFDTEIPLRMAIPQAGGATAVPGPGRYHFSMDHELNIIPGAFFDMTAG